MDFGQISTLLVLAAGFGVIAKFAKQPLLVGFIFAGLVATYFGWLNDLDGLSALGKIGVTLLLFLVGIEMNMKEISTIGKVALVTGLGQIIFTSLFGFVLSRLLGFPLVSSIYIAVALTFSSTIIIVKLLSEKKDLNSLYGRISIGFLLIQDLVAVLILMFLAGLRSGNTNIISLLLLVLKASVLFGLTWYLSKKILPSIFTKLVGGSYELLFVVSIAWALGVSALVGGPLGFSFEIGGFLAGLSLSNLPEHLGVANKMKPLRDFFLTIFFLTLGSQLLVTEVSGVVLPAIIFSIFVLVGNPLIVLLLMGILGYKKRTSFLASVTVAQISEFSFILMSMGLFLGHVQQTDVTTVVIVGAITMTVSTYLILGAEKIYTKISKFLSVFERTRTNEILTSKDSENLNNHVVIVGCDRTGRSLLKYFTNKGTGVLVVDHNPSVFKNLSSTNTKIILGDALDEEIQDMMGLEKAKIVVCTISSLTESLSILEKIRSLKNKPAFVGSVQTKAEAITLYEKGADYVLVPEIIAGEFLRHVFVSHGVSGERIHKMGKSHFNRLMYSS